MSEKLFSYGLTVALASALCAVPSRSGAQIFALDPAGPPGPGRLPLPVVGLTPAAELGLLAADVIDAISIGDDGAIGVTLYFTVSRYSPGAVRADPGRSVRDMRRATGHAARRLERHLCLVRSCLCAARPALTGPRRERPAACGTA